jgi:hypothetical protein
MTKQDRYSAQEIVDHLKKLSLLKSKASVISSIPLSAETTPHHLSEEIDFGAIKIKGGNAYLWILKNGSAALWRDVTRAAALMGSEKFLFIGKGTAPWASEKVFGYIITDHINVSGQNPLIGPNDDMFGDRFPDMTGLYNNALNEKIISCFENARLPYRKSVCLIPKNKNELTTLEKDIIDLRQNVVLSRDVFAGAISAKQMSKEAVGILFPEDIPRETIESLVVEIVCRL